MLSVQRKHFLQTFYDVSITFIWFLCKQIVLYPHCILITSLHRIKLWEETDEAVGMQQGYGQIGAWSTPTREGGRVAKDDCLCGVHNEKTTLQAERPNLNSKWHEALRAKTGNAME